MDSKTLREFIPIMPIESPDDECILSRRGDITFAWRVYLPVAYTVNEPGYDSIITSFMQAYKLLPPYCVVHKQDVFKYDRYKPEFTGHFLEDSYEKHFENRKYLNGYSYIFLTFSTKSVIETKSSGSGFFSAASGKLPSEKRIRDCASLAHQFEAVLNNNPLLSLEPLTASAFVSVGEHGEDIGLLPEYLNLYSEPDVNYPLEFEASHVRYGDDIIAKAWYIEDSDSYPGTAKSVSIVNGMSGGNAIVTLSGGSPIGFGLKIPHVVNRYVLTLPRKEVEQELEQKKKLMTSFSLYSAPCRVNAQELDAYLDENARNGLVTVKCFTDVIAWGKPSEIDGIRSQIRTAFSELDMTVSEEMRTMPLLYYAGIPGAATELGYDYYMTSEMNGFLCHGLWDGYDSGIKGGIIKVNDRNRMIPFKVDFQGTARERGFVDNLNALVVGPSGSGKSFTMNHIVRNLYYDGQHIFIIDVGDSYEGICKVINEETGGKDGIYNSYDPENPLSFNPFKGRKRWGEVDAEGEMTSSGFSFFMSLLKTMFKPKYGWEKNTTSILESFVNHFFDIWDNGYPESLEEALQQAYVNAQRARAEKDKKKFNEGKARIGWMNPLPEIFTERRLTKDPIFDDFYRFVTHVVCPLIMDGSYKVGDINITPDMFDINGFAASLVKYKKDGTYGFLLNAEEEKDYFSSRLTVYEVNLIKDNEDLFPLWVLSIMHSFEEKMYTLSCPKAMIIEEAWSAIAKPEMAGFIVWMWRTARKYSTSAIVVTQSLSDLMSSDIVKDAIIQNSSTKIFLDQRKNANNFTESAKALAFNPMDVSLVLSVNRSLNPNYMYKECFFSIGEQYSNVFGIEVSLEEALVYESEKKKKKPVFELAKEQGSYIEAVKELAYKIRNNHK